MEPTAPAPLLPKRRSFFTWRRILVAFLAALPFLWLGGVGVKGANHWTVLVTPQPVYPEIRS